jgi:hypothetical protein
VGNEARIQRERNHVERILAMKDCVLMRQALKKIARYGMEQRSKRIEHDRNIAQIVAMLTHMINEQQSQSDSQRVCMLTKRTSKTTLPAAKCILD